MEDKKILFIKTFLFTMLFFCLTCLNAHAEIIFEDNFDNQMDWTVSQANTYTITKLCVPGAICDPAPPLGWSGYYIGGSHCAGGPGNNSLILDSINARGETGKGLTFWDESCTENFEDSDANLGIKLNKAYDEIYIKFHIKLQPDYKIRIDGYNAHKMMHIQYYCGSGSPWHYFATKEACQGLCPPYSGSAQGCCNKPTTVPGFKYYAGNYWYYIAYRCEQDYYCQGTPSYGFDVGTDQDHLSVAPWTGSLGDGEWHSMEYYFKINSNSGDIFNKDGVHKYWFDGNLVYDSSTHNGGEGIPFSDSGSSVQPRKGFNFVSIGGNNANRWTTNCSGTGCEQWYAVDDFVVSTEYIGPDYVIGQQGKTWQETLEQQFDIAETFDHYDDWTGTASKAAQPFVTDSGDLPSYADGSASTIWKRYAYNPDGEKDGEGRLGQWIGNQGSAYQIGNKGLKLSTRGFGPLEMQTYFGDGSANSGYAEIFVFFRAYFPKDAFPTNTNPADCGAHGVMQYNQSVYDTHGYLWLSAWKFINFGTGFTSVNTHPDGSYYYGDKEAWINLSNSYNDRGQHAILAGQAWSDQGSGSESIAFDQLGAIEIRLKIENYSGAEISQYGDCEIWWYDPNGAVKTLLSKDNLQIMAPEDAGHLINRLTINGNKHRYDATGEPISPQNYNCSTGEYTIKDTMAKFWYLDDFIIDDQRIGPRYFELLRQQSGQITGDLNSDGKVDITDVQACVNHVLGAQDWGGAADVNSDGSVNVIDVQEIVNVILA